MNSGEKGDGKGTQHKVGRNVGSKEPVNITTFGELQRERVGKKTGGSKTSSTIRGLGGVIKKSAKRR